MNTRFITAFYLACFLLTLSILPGCGSAGENRLGGKLAPAFEEITKDKFNEVIRSSAKPFVLVNFYASWCGPCRAEIPDLIELENDPEQKVQVIMISVDNEDAVQNKLSTFLTEQGVNFKTWVKSAASNEFIKEIYSNYDNRIPLSLLYTNKGKFIQAIEGITNQNEIKLLINRYQVMQDA